jgi:hypothetical protein
VFRQTRSADHAPQFDFGVIHDRRRLIAAARCLLRQLGPQPGAD